MVKLMRWGGLVWAGLVLLGLLGGVPTGLVSAQGAGCQMTLPSDKAGARITVEVLERRPNGERVTVAGPGREVEARSNQLLRLVIRPLEGPAQPNGASCPVRVAFGRLTSVAQLRTEQGFIFDRRVAYGEFRPDEERVLEFEVDPFTQWDSVSDKIEFEDLTIRLPEATEFLNRLPPPYQPALGTVCADVLHPDAQPAAGIPLVLVAPPGGPPDNRTTGADGRVCWEGFDETLFGSLSLGPGVDAALGQPDERYISRQANYRLFVVKRAG